MQEALFVGLGNQRLRGKKTIKAQMVKNLPTMQETRFQSLGLEDLLKNAIATHSGILA